MQSKGLYVVLAMTTVVGAIGCALSQDDVVPADEGSLVEAGFTLLVSSSPTRTAATPLDGAAVPAAAYVFTSDASGSATPAGITQVRYWLDDTAMSGTPMHVEDFAPFDLVGSAPPNALVWDTTTLANGSHTLTQSVTPTTGAIVNTTATFTVDTGSTAPLCGAGCNNYYVSTTGSDSNNGTSASTPWRHISKAIASFSLGTAGAVINVHAGTYSDENISCVGYKSAVCMNRGGSSPTVRLRLVCDTPWSVPSGSGCLLRDPNGNDLVAIAANNVDVGAIGRRGFDVSNPGRADAIDTPCGGLPHIATGTCTTGNSTHILGNYVHDMSQVVPCLVNPNGNPAITFNNNHGAKMDDGQVIGNRITNIGPQAQSSLNGGPGCFNNYGMYISSSSVRVQNNVIANVAGYGVHYYSAACDGVISNNTIVRSEFNNIIYGGGDCNNGIALGSGNISNNVLGATAGGRANIQVGVPGGGAACSSSHPNLVSNNVFVGGPAAHVATNSTSTACTTVLNSKTEAPTTTFASFTGGNDDNFHLKAGSVAVGGGTSSCTAAGLVPCTPSKDFDGLTESPLPAGAFVGPGSP